MFFPGERTHKDTVENLTQTQDILNWMTVLTFASLFLPVIYFIESNYNFLYSAISDFMLLILMLHSFLKCIV